MAYNVMSGMFGSIKGMSKAAKDFAKTMQERVPGKRHEEPKLGEDTQPPYNTSV
jgi:hypothetical protein